jgi:hypothetical protein
MSIFVNYLVLPITLILLLVLIIMTSRKLYIYFDTFMYLSKKQNYDKTNYIANSSFFKYFYKNKQLWGYYSIELVITIIMLFLSILAYIGYITTGHKNFGFLNYYYGDSIEYYFVNFFINIIILLTIIYSLGYIYWYISEKSEDDKLEENEELLKIFIIDNLSYEYLWNYYITVIVGKKDTYTIQNFISSNATDLNYFDNYDNIFKLCFTNYILNEKTEHKRYIYIKNGILERIKKIYDIKLGDSQFNNIKKIKNAFNIKENNSFNDFYIIANYNHNSNIVLPPLYIMIDNMIKTITITNVDSLTQSKVNKLNECYENIKKNKNADSINKLYEKCVSYFMETLKIYKIVYDKYTQYYMGSVLISNFIITYAVLIFIYIILKLLNEISSFASAYSIYDFRSHIMNYGIFILIIYFFITCPIIIFGFN